MRRVIALLALSLPLAVGAQSFGKWVVIPATDASGDVIAATGTESGSEILGHRCFVSTGSCTYVLSAGITCEAGHEYPMLMNAPSGSAMVTGSCIEAQSGNELLLSPYKTVEAAIKGGGIVGFAVPMQSGLFQAVRFSGLGGTSAIEEAARQALRNRARTRQKATGTTTF